MQGFALSPNPLDPAALRAALANPAAGALAVFEGWVRNHHHGQAVVRLEYEAYEALACREGERILAEVRGNHEVLHAACVHRTGALEVGDLAVWVGVCSAHRDAALDACRYIIEEVKRRVPIWKKEHFADGTAQWVNCACAHTPGAVLQPGGSKP